MGWVLAPARCRVVSLHAGVNSNLGWMCSWCACGHSLSSCGLLCSTKRRFHMWEEDREAGEYGHLRLKNPTAEFALMLGIFHIFEREEVGCLIWVAISELPSTTFPSTHLLPSFYSLQEKLPCSSCADGREVWLLSYCWIWEYGLHSPFYLVPSCLGLSLRGSELPRKETWFSLWVFCVADPSSAGGKWKDVASLCVTEELEVGYGVAATFLSMFVKEGGQTSSLSRTTFGKFKTQPLIWPSCQVQ